MSDDGGDDRLIDLLAAADDALAAGDTASYVESVTDGDLAFLRQVRLSLQPTTKPTMLGRFRIVRELGRGSFGVVFLADDPVLGRQVALKVPHPEALVSAGLRDRFRREARAAAGLDHPNIVPVYEAGEAGAVSFLVSAYCPGETLAQWLRGREEPVPVREAAGLLASIADGVGHAHSRGVVHRDLKPANILLASGASHGPGNAPTPGPTPGPLPAPLAKITDFGLAKLLAGHGDDAPTRSGAVVGTVQYMAPEQAAGKSALVGPAADVYALGCILYELLTGRPPFRGDSDIDTLQQVQHDEPVPPSRLRPRLPRDLETVGLKCLAKEPARRYPHAAALADDLRRFLGGQPVQARSAGPVERMGRWVKRRPAVAALGDWPADRLPAGPRQHDLRARDQLRRHAVGVVRRGRPRRTLGCGHGHGRAVVGRPR